MSLHFLFPASPLNPNVIDPDFRDQANALKSAGFGTSAIELLQGKPVGAVPEGSTLVYRGWMMNAAEYDGYAVWIKRWGTPFTTPEQYLATHYLPNWYPLLEKYTPATVSFGGYSPEIVERVYNFALGAFSGMPEGGKLQLKDYVKSLKTAGGSVVTSADEIKEVLAKMEKYRGTIEGGVVLRKYEEFYQGSEKRYFVINGRFYGEETSFDLRHMNILEQVKEAIPSPFFSVDIALRVDGRARLVEIGDGQVSDIVGWTPERFAAIWKESQ